MPIAVRDGMTEAEVVQLCNSLIQQVLAIQNGRATVSRTEFIKMGNRLIIAFAHWRDCSDFARERITSASVDWRKEAENRAYRDDDELYDLVTKLRSLWFDNLASEYQGTVNNPFDMEPDFDESLVEQVLVNPVFASDFSLAPESSENCRFVRTNVDGIVEGSVSVWDYFED